MISAAAGSEHEQTEAVSYALRDGVAVLTVCNPPVNALVQIVRQALFECIERAETDDSVGAVVIQAEGRTFPAGADVREFTLETANPTLAALCDRVEACKKPVIAAIHGTALGGGFELALAAHYRMALEGARFGFPEITLGLVPTAGGSQRLPRIVGARAALDILVTGAPMDAARAEALGLVDKVVHKNLERAALGSARNMIESGTAPRPSRDQTRGLAEPARFLELVEARRKVTARDRKEATARAIDLVEAALLLPFEAGARMEHVAYEDLINSPDARGLRHAFLAERRAGRSDRIMGVKPRPVSTVGVIGAGPLARDVAMSALAAGASVRVALEDDPAINRVRTRIEASFANAVEAGRVTGSERDARLARLSVAEGFDSLADCDVVIEALPEDPVRKSHVLGRLASNTLSASVIASSSAESDIPALAAASGRGGSFAAMHFIAPADRNRLVEIAPTTETEPDVMATLTALARKMGKTPVLTKARRGLIFNRVVSAYYSAAALLLERGAMPADVDAAMRDFGMPLGPFQAQDIAGLDAVWGLRAEDCASRIPLLMLENAWYGQRTGQGFYRYENGARGGRAAPDVMQMIRQLREAQALKAQSFSADEVQKRCLYAMANEGARLVASGTVARPSDVDAALLLGLGFPRTKGGPMLQADLIGSLQVRKALSSWADENAFWTPAPLWTELVKNGRTFEDLDARA
ncbi:enoyl-CoA hydratase-related protein [Maritimibacter dapengensis]|uniref:Enoyl-CoA hydratase/isomerase family protein n=1 Tax=Maritimibacter dapengensis TaxID=2836868 RepID=A0ABS6SYL5_9RHOB|nr:enoyl-CoA hydratase-related protein [Maritimibacter dapengensis]MBV7378058.1 enoyl-CoA hydratase/isomerase family protein [Maritimibacter dapengensis]